MSLRTTPTAIARVEAAAIDLLKAGLDPEYFIDLFPADPSKFDTSNRPKCALVQYIGSAYQAPSGVREGMQNRRASFRLHLVLNAARTEVVPEAEIEDARLALQAALVEGARLVISRDGLMRNEGPMWEYFLDFELELPAVPVLRPVAQTFPVAFEKDE